MYLSLYRNQLNSQMSPRDLLLLSAHSTNFCPQSVPLWIMFVEHSAASQSKLEVLNNAINASTSPAWLPSSCSRAITIFLLLQAVVLCESESVDAAANHLEAVFQNEQNPILQKLLPQDKCTLAQVIISMTAFAKNPFPSDFAAQRIPEYVDNPICVSFSSQMIVNAQGAANKFELFMSLFGAASTDFLPLYFSYINFCTSASLFHQAITCCQQFLTEHESCTEMWFTYATVEEQAQHYDECEQILKRATEQFPKSLPLWYKYFGFSLAHKDEAHLCAVALSFCSSVLERQFEPDFFTIEACVQWLHVLIGRTVDASTSAFTQLSAMFKRDVFFWMIYLLLCSRVCNYESLCDKFEYTLSSMEAQHVSDKHWVWFEYMLLAQKQNHAELFRVLSVYLKLAPKALESDPLKNVAKLIDNSRFLSALVAPLRIGTHSYIMELCSKIAAHVEQQPLLVGELMIAVTRCNLTSAKIALQHAAHVQVHNKALAFAFLNKLLRIECYEQYQSLWNMYVSVKFFKSTGFWNWHWKWSLERNQQQK